MALHQSFDTDFKQDYQLIPVCKGVLLNDSKLPVFLSRILTGSYLLQLFFGLTSILNSGAVQLGTDGQGDQTVQRFPVTELQVPQQSSITPTNPANSEPDYPIQIFITYFSNIHFSIKLTSTRKSSSDYFK